MNYNTEPIVLEACNLFCGVNPDASSNESQHLRLTTVKLPGFEESYLDHRPGGAPVAIEIDVIFNRLQCDFVLAGWTPHTAELISAWSSQQQRFYFYGALRDQLNPTQLVQAQATMIGRLGRADPHPFSRGQLHAWDYSIRGLISYKLTVGDEQVYAWDFFNNSLAINGQ